MFQDLSSRKQHLFPLPCAFSALISISLPVTSLLPELFSMIKGSGRPVVNLGWAQKIQDTEDADKYSYGCLKCGETVTKAYKQASIGQAFHGKGGKVRTPFEFLSCHQLS